MLATDLAATSVRLAVRLPGKRSSSACTASGARTRDLSRISSSSFGNARISSNGGSRGGRSAWQRSGKGCAVRAAGGSVGPGGGGGGDSMDKVRLLIGMATRDDKKRGFGPPPPKDKASGSGLVNLTGREDLMSGRREFDLPFSSSTPPEALLAQARARAKAQTLARSRAGKTEGPCHDGGSGDGEGDKLGCNDGMEEDDVEGTGSSARASAPTSLPLDLTPAQAAIAAGMLAVTALAVGNSSRSFLPDDVIWFLQVWMAAAWSTHCLLGAIAAFMCQQPGTQFPASAAQKWFFKISLAGFLAFVEFWNTRNGQKHI